MLDGSNEGQLSLENDIEGQEGAAKVQIINIPFEHNVEVHENSGEVQTI